MTNCFSVNVTGGINCMDRSERVLAEENWRKNSSHNGFSVLNPDCEYGSGRRVEIEKLSMLERCSNEVLQASTKYGRGPSTSQKKFNCNASG